MNKILISILLFLPLSSVYVFSVKPTAATCAEMHAGSEKHKIRLLDEIDHDEEGRPVTTHFSESESGLFRVHYNIEGSSAVELTDLNQNSIPDYVDSVLYYADYVNDLYTYTLGYKPFAVDLGEGGSKQYDIYLWDTGDEKEGISGFYGMCISNGIRNEINGVRSYYSYIVMDNDFSLSDSSWFEGVLKPTFGTTHGYDALKVTVAHELHHSVQYSYGISKYSGGSFQEMTSVYFEYRVFPEIKDYYQYTNMMLESPEYFAMGSIENGLTPYAFGVFFQYFEKLYGDEGVRRIWEMSAEGVEHFRAVDSIAKNHGSNIEQLWNDFLITLYHTGDRAVEGEGLDDAADLKTLAPYKRLDMQYPETREFFALKPFEVRFYRLDFPSIEGRTNDTLDLLIANPDVASASMMSNRVSNFEWSVSYDDPGDSELLDALGVYFGESVERNGDIIKLEKPGTEPVFIEYAFPNPFVPDISENVYFPVTKKALPGDKAVLNLYNVDMVPIYNSELNVIIAGSDKPVVKIENAAEIMGNAGVFIWTVEHKQGSTAGKVAVKK